MKLNQYGLNIGDHLDPKIMSKWENDGYNVFDGNTWRKATSGWSPDSYRIIEGFEEHNGVVGFLVSSTEGWYLRAEGFKEFENNLKATGSSKPELTSLPEKWCILPKTSEEQQIIGKWFDKRQGTTSPFYARPENTPRYHTNAFGTGDVWYNDKSGNLLNIPEITFDQFKKWVLKEEAKPTPKFEVGKVYWSNNGSNGGYIFKVKSFTDMYVSYYHQIYPDKEEFFIDSGLNNAHWANLRLATKEEIEWLEMCITANKFVPFVSQAASQTKESLLEEAKRRYPVGTKVKSIVAGYSGKITSHKERATGANQIWFEGKHIDDQRDINILIYDNGKWAEIISTSKTEQKESQIPQGKLTKEQLVEGRWYTVSSNSGKYKWMIKYRASPELTTYSKAIDVTDNQICIGGAMKICSDTGVTSIALATPPDMEIVYKFFPEERAPELKPSSDFKVGDWVVFNKTGGAISNKHGSIKKGIPYQIKSLSRPFGSDGNCNAVFEGGLEARLSSVDRFSEKGHYEAYFRRATLIEMAEAAPAWYDIEEDRAHKRFEKELMSIKPYYTSGLSNFAALSSAPTDYFNWPVYDRIPPRKVGKSYIDHYQFFDPFKDQKQDSIIAAGYSLLAGQNKSQKTKPSSKVSVKCNEEFKITIKQKQSIKL